MDLDPSFAPVGYIRSPVTPPVFFFSGHDQCSSTYQQTSPAANNRRYASPSEPCGYLKTSLTFSFPSRGSPAQPSVELLKSVNPSFGLSTSIPVVPYLIMTNFSSVTGSHIPTLSQGIVLLASIVSAIVYLFAKTLLSKRPVDERGNSIPNGPIGMPFLGLLNS